ncbi:UNVERIFIED_CONTAM: hypothetical protein Cloal_3387 [Acetivibrio alkalicellulosi]
MIIRKISFILVAIILITTSMTFTSMAEIRRTNQY